MTTVTFRPDEQDRRHLEQLKSDGATTSQAIREALALAVRLRRREQVRQETEAAMADPEQVAESARVHRQMVDLAVERDELDDSEPHAAR